MKIKGLAYTIEDWNPREHFQRICEVLVADSTYAHPLTALIKRARGIDRPQNYLIDIVLFMTWHDREICIRIICQQGATFTELQEYVLRELACTRFATIRVVPVLDSVWNGHDDAASSQKRCDYLQDSQLRTLGKWFACPSINGHLSPLYDALGSGPLYNKRNRLHVKENSRDWFVSALLLETQHWLHHAALNLKICIG